MARIGGAFPFPTGNVSEGVNKIELASGGVWYFPQGEYLVLTDATSRIQYWDPVENAWRTLIAESSGGYINCDGFNYRALNRAGAVDTIAITNAGSTMTNGIGAAGNVTASIAASDTAGGARATLYAIVGGSVPAYTVTQGGSGFLVPPLVVIDPCPAGGIQATAVATISALGVVTAITIVNAGAGYASVPNCYLIPQPAVYQGSTSGGFAAGAIPAPGLVHPTNAVPGNQNTSVNGALITPGAALGGSGTLTGLKLINWGGGYTTANPAITFVNGAGGVAATATSTTNTNTNALVLVQPRVQ